MYFLLLYLLLSISKYRKWAKVLNKLVFFRGAVVIDENKHFVIVFCIVDLVPFCYILTSLCLIHQFCVPLHTKTDQFPLFRFCMKFFKELKNVCLQQNIYNGIISPSLNPAKFFQFNFR